MYLKYGIWKTNGKTDEGIDICDLSPMIIYQRNHNYLFYRRAYQKLFICLYYL